MDFATPYFDLFIVSMYFRHLLFSKVFLNTPTTKMVIFCLTFLHSARIYAHSFLKTVNSNGQILTAKKKTVKNLILIAHFSKMTICREAHPPGRMPMTGKTANPSGASLKKMTSKNGIPLSNKISPNIDVDGLIKKHGKQLLTNRSKKALQEKCNVAERMKANFAAKCNYADKTQSVETQNLMAAVKLHENGFNMAFILLKFPNIQKRTLYRVIERKKKNQPLIPPLGRPQADLPPSCKKAVEEERAKLQSNGTGFSFKNFENVVKANNPDKKKKFAKKTLNKLMKQVVPATTKASMTSTLAREKAKKNICNYISWACGLTAMIRKFRNESEKRRRKAGKVVDEKAPFMTLHDVSNIDGTSAETKGSHTNDKNTEPVHTTEEFKVECRTRGQSIHKPPTVLGDGKHYMPISISHILNATLK